MLNLEELWSDNLDFRDLVQDNPLTFVKNICKKVFVNDKLEPFEIYDYQAEIISSILFNEDKRVVCWATTRAGKSLAIALGIILLVCIKPGRKVRIIAPTDKHTQVIMNYVIQHLFDSQFVKNRLLIDVDSGERLKKQISRNRITFKDNSEVQIITANINSEGRTLIGMGGTDIFIDETELIPEEIIRSKIMRMLGDTPDSSIFMISNPHKKNYMYSKMNDPNWKKIKVDWQMCVEQGRFTPEFVQERRDEMTPVEFKIWYDSEYPEDSEDTLIKWAWIESAVRDVQAPLMKPFKVCGADIAAGGVDSTVITPVYKYDSLWMVQEPIEVNFGPEITDPTLRAFDLIIKTDKEHNFDYIEIDSTGIGQGVFETASRNEQIKNKAERFISGENKDLDEDEKKVFMNKKAWAYFRLAKLFEKGQIVIPDNHKLKAQLNGIKYEVQEGSGKLKIIKKEEGSKSPDFADSLMMAISYRESGVLFDFGD